ncbi:MAG: SDR family oxidoreductase [Propionibacteriaceae bacterium]|jgi:NAD(P)-dependent dehydrogenase (short-subunit alcohol dehydrogenase family)|nr:SDR family oxidoreductase [Propionibacteriaceae bacterium]
MDLQLAGRAYYVTGLSRGVGSAVARALLAEGAFVAGCARDATRLGQWYAGVPDDQRDRVLVAAVDVLDADRLAAAVATAARRFGRLDGVVAGAGTGTAGGVLDTLPAQWDAQLRLKTHSVLNLVRPAVPALRESDAARIVVINGVIAHVPDSGHAATSAARAAVANLTRSLAVELAPAVLVNAVNLGAIMTDRQRERYEASGMGQSIDEWAAGEAARRGILVGRLGQVAEVVPVVLLLLSPVSSYLTGTAIDVSGGSGTTP